MRPSPSRSTSKRDQQPRPPTTCSSRPRRRCGSTRARAARSVVRGSSRSDRRRATRCASTALRPTSKPIRIRRTGCSTLWCAMAARTITFLSDYGLGDEFVGVVHGVIAGICPQGRVIALGHGVPRQDVQAGALTLERALPYMPAGVHLAVVDPEVGARRRAVALRTAEEDRLLVGPDNGLLIPAAERFGGVLEAIEISASPWRLEPVSATFHGRDLFAPVAARLATGSELAEAGAPVEPGELVRIELPRAAIEAGALEALVTGTDGFGNVTLGA